MGRALFLIILMVFSGIVYLIKAGASKVTGGKEVNFKDESQKVMDKTAKGVQWMNDQWDEAKSNAKSDTKKIDD